MSAHKSTCCLKKCISVTLLPALSMAKQGTNYIINVDSEVYNDFNNVYTKLS